MYRETNKNWKKICIKVDTSSFILFPWIMILIAKI